MPYALPTINSPARRSIFRPAALLLAGLWLLTLAPFSPALAQTCSAPLEALPQLDQATTDKFFNTEAVQAFYKRWGARCAWNDQQANLLLARISRAADDGINPGFFDTRLLTNLMSGKTAAAARQRDLVLSDLALRYARIMSMGQADPSIVYNNVFLPARKLDLTDSLVTTLARGNISEWLQDLAPQNRAYVQLKDMLAFYRRLQKNGGWQSLPPGPTLRPGEADPHLPDLRRRLNMEGDLAVVTDAPVLDDATVNALKRFQARHGISPDGILGPKTRQMLDIPVDVWVQRIDANLDRWRYFGPSLPATRFEVNVAAGQARLVSENGPPLVMRAIVGKARNRTPILLSAISEIVLNPSWTIPYSIIRNEIPRSLRHDPTYLAHNDMHWSGSALIQAPGPANPLGRLKFVFANPFSVYLHDTPATQLFIQDNRARSHGCVRLERALDLATYLLAGDPGWTRSEIQAAIATQKTIRIPLTKRLPVAVLYWTAFVSPDGIFEFRNDIYGRDSRLIEAIAHRLAATPGIEAKAPKG